MWNDVTAPRLVVLFSGLALVGLFASGCDERAATGPDLEALDSDLLQLSEAGATDELTADVRRQLAELREATAAYHDIEEAMADGWTLRFPEPCLTHDELGGMGYHLLNPDLLDDEVAVGTPEFLVYEPGPDGTLQLVSVEYVITFDDRPSDASPPHLFERHFHANETFGVWALHVWAWRANPNGVFADWNPLVSCEHANDVLTFPRE